MLRWRLRQRALILGLKSPTECRKHQFALTSSPTGRDSERSAGECWPVSWIHKRHSPEGFEINSARWVISYHVLICLQLYIQKGRMLSNKMCFSTYRATLSSYVWKLMWSTRAKCQNRLDTYLWWRNADRLLLQSASDVTTSCTATAHGRVCVPLFLVWRRVHYNHSQGFFSDLAILL